MGSACQVEKAYSVIMAASDYSVSLRAIAVGTARRQAVGAVLSVLFRPGGLGAEAGMTHRYPDGSRCDTLPQWDSLLKGTRWDDPKTERTHKGRLRY